MVRFKNVALWSFKSAREEFYRALEKTFADYFNVPFSGKNDRWRSLGVLEAEFKVVKEGEGKNKHDRCKTVAYTKPRVAFAECNRNLASPLFGHSCIKGTDLAAA